MFFTTNGDKLHGFFKMCFLAYKKPSGEIRDFSESFETSIFGDRVTEEFINSIHWSELKTFKFVNETLVEEEAKWQGFGEILETRLWWRRKRNGKDSERY